MSNAVTNVLPELAAATGAVSAATDSFSLTSLEGTVVTLATAAVAWLIRLLFNKIGRSSPPAAQG